MDMTTFRITFRNTTRAGYLVAAVFHNGRSWYVDINNLPSSRGTIGLESVQDSFLHINRYIKRKIHDDL